ncbi:MAG: type III-A CRISPR-associated RAMP protein Csm3 [Desulfurobacteriaceae bacterium]
MKKLDKILLIKGKIKLLTGLHIGAGDNQIQIGGIDNPVVRDPVTKEPYIPGSSVKGKMRHLLELRYGFFNGEGGPSDIKSLGEGSDENKVNILKLFGVSGAESEEAKKRGITPTRLSFYDLKLKNADLLKKVGPLMTEDKAEVKVNRITGTGENPRHTERVPAGAEFELKLALKVFDGDDEKGFCSLIEEGLKLIEADSLGGNGSRGYGKVKFVIEEISSVIGEEAEQVWEKLKEQFKEEETQ